MSAIDPRDTRSAEILAGSEHWSPIFNGQGEPVAFGVPSATTPNLVYITTHEKCTCPAARKQNLCKHSRAVRSYVIDFARQHGMA